MPKRLAGKEIGTPAGGILSTIDDLHLWNQKLYGQNSKARNTKRIHKKVQKGNMLFWENGLCLWHYAEYRKTGSLFP